MPVDIAPLRETTSRLLRAAWNEPDRFDWFSEYLRIHGLRVLARILIAVTVGFISLIPAVMLLSPAGAQTLPLQVAAVAVSVLGLTLAACWAVAPWPTSSQSLLFIVVADALITAGCGLDSMPLAGLMGATILAAIGGYVAFFHGARVLLAHIGWSAIVVVTLATAIALDGDIALALTKGLVVAVANIVVPVASLLMLGLLGADSERSTSDPLTGLINRRGLERAIPGLVRTGHRIPDHAVAVLAIDLDDFKRVNDSLGHEVGDRVLAETAHRLRALATGATLVCRTGGEEFVVVALVPVRSMPGLAEAIRTAIVSPNEGLTVSASIGVAWTAGDQIGRSADAQPAVAQLTRSADRAMYEAKRAGGNRVRFHSATSDPTTPSVTATDRRAP